MTDAYHPPLDPLRDRNREDLVGWAAKLITFESAAAIELRGRIDNAIKLLGTDTAPQHVIAVLEGREPW